MLSNTPEIVRKNGGVIIYDPSLVSCPSEQIFDSSAHAGSDSFQKTESGRGASYYLDMNGVPMVLRNYRRGGLVGRVLHDQYLRFGTQNSRSFREFKILWQLHQEGFPVPRPAAAWFEPHGIYYRAALMTLRIADVETLGHRLIHNGLDAVNWLALGRLIRQFHQRGVYHADLNGHNILLDDGGKMYLLDFDRASIRRGSLWKKANLRRLRRSIKKIHNDDHSGFENNNWRAFLMAYNA